jgi:hypothetical protein
MTTAVVGNAAITARSQKEHLFFKGVRTQRPTVTKNDGLPIAPVFVINMCAVLGVGCVHRFVAWFSSESLFFGKASVSAPVSALLSDTIAFTTQANRRLGDLRNSVF